MIIEDKTVPIELRTINIGKHAPGIWTCPHCGNDMWEIGTDTCCVGFGETHRGVMAVIECNNCFERFHYHAHGAVFDSVMLTRKRLAIQEAREQINAGEAAPEAPQ